MKRFFLTVIVVLTASMEATSGDPEPAGRDVLIHPAIVSALRLTPAQTAHIAALRRAFREEMDPLRERLLARRLELGELWAKSPPEREAIRRKQEEIQAIQQEMQDRMMRYQLECRRVLTPEQQEKLGALLGEHVGRGLLPDSRPASPAGDR